MKHIDALLNRHAGQTIWIFGKGPSLDDFQVASAGEVRICINESLRAVPRPTYFFAHDEGPIHNVANTWPEQCSAILQLPRAIFAEQCGIPTDAIFVYEKRYCDNAVRDMNAASLARHRCLYGNSGTVHCAIDFCRLIGATRVVMVGFDGTGGYAKSIHLPDGGAEHDRIRRDSVSLLNALAIPYEFFGSCNADKSGGEWVHTGAFPVIAAYCNPHPLIFWPEREPLSSSERRPEETACGEIRDVGG